jgi:hypothetical protein
MSPATSRLLRAAPVVVPALYVAVALAAQPGDRLGPAPATAWLGQAFYDDYDFAAMALRGLNDARGRDAGRADEPPGLGPAAFSAALDTPAPLAPRYYLEYPHAALLLFRLPFALFPPPADVPAVVLDGGQWDVVEHAPRDDRERELLRAFRRATRTYLLVMLGCLFALVAVLRAGYEPGGGLSSGGLLLVLPATLYFALNRFDVIPALLTALAFTCLGRRRLVASAVFLAAGTLVKVYPVLLAPLVVRHLAPRLRPTRAAAVWSLAYAGALAAFLGFASWVWGWEAVAAPYRVQLSREPFGPVAYGTMLPESLAKNDAAGRTFRLGSLVAAAAALCWRPLPRLEDVLRRGAVLVTLFIALAVFFSPQWVVWLTPMVLPLAPRDWRAAALFVALDLVMFLTFPVGVGVVAPVLGAVLTYSRFALFAALAWALLRPRPAEGALESLPAAGAA